MKTKLLAAIVFVLFANVSPAHAAEETMFTRTKTVFGDLSPDAVLQCFGTARVIVVHDIMVARTEGEEKIVAGFISVNILKPEGRGTVLVVPTGGDSAMRAAMRVVPHAYIYQGGVPTLHLSGDTNGALKHLISADLNTALHDCKKS